MKLKVLLFIYQGQSKFWFVFLQKMVQYAIIDPVEAFFKFFEGLYLQASEIQG